MDQELFEIKKLPCFQAFPDGEFASFGLKGLSTLTKFPRKHENWSRRSKISENNILVVLLSFKHYRQASYPLTRQCFSRRSKFSMFSFHFVWL